MLSQRVIFSRIRPKFFFRCYRTCSEGFFSTRSQQHLEVEFLFSLIFEFLQNYFRSCPSLTTHQMVYQNLSRSSRSGSKRAAETKNITARRRAPHSWAETCQRNVPTSPTTLPSSPTRCGPTPTCTRNSRTRRPSSGSLSAIASKPESTTPVSRLITGNY